MNHRNHMKQSSAVQALVVGMTLLAGATSASAQCLLDLVEPSQPSAGAAFGHDGAIAGDYAILGAPWDEANGFQNAGSADVYRRAGNSWVHHARLTSPDIFSFNLFGKSVDIDGEIAIVGEPHNNVGETVNIGRVHLYYRNASNQWVYGTTFNPGNSPFKDFGRFGNEVALDGDYMVIGMPGGPSNQWNSDPGLACIYKRTFGFAGWQLEHVLHCPWNIEDMEYGGVLAVQHGTNNQNTVAVVGLPNYSASFFLPQSGRVHVHSKPSSGINWSGYTAIAPSDPQSQASFGCAVAVDGDTMAVGACGYDLPNVANVGAVYIFKREPGTTNWVEVDKVTCPEEQADVEFGTNVAIQGEWIMVSSKWRSYLLRRGIADQWEHEWTIKSTQGEIGSPAVGEVGLSGDSIMLTNPFYGTNDMYNFGIGSIYRFNDTQGSNTCVHAPLITTSWVSGCTHTATRDGSAWCEGSGQGADVWYKWIAPCTGTVTFDTAYSDFDTVLSVHSQCPSGGNSNVLACNNNVSPNDNTSSVTLNVQGGTWYTIRIASASSIISGWYILNVNFECAPNCPADIAPQPDGNNVVDVDDLLAVINSWGGNGPADIAPSGGNGVVDVDDLLAVINAWGVCQ
jgi:hypothetical protein